MSGGKKQQAASAAPITQSQISVPPQTDFSQYKPQGVGMTSTPQTYWAGGKPKWMTGVWDMPTWGEYASKPGTQISNDTLLGKDNPALQVQPPQMQQSQQQQMPQQPGTFMAAYQEYLRQRQMSEYYAGLSATSAG